MHGSPHAPARTRGLPVASLALAALVLGARAVTACGAGDDGDDGPGVLPGAPEGGAGGGDARTGSDPGDGALADDGASRDGGPPPPPSFCRGIVLRVSFDRGIVPDEGGGRVRPDTGVRLAEGKFERGVELTNTTDGGAPAVFFDRASADAGDGGGDGGDAGPPPVVYPEREGSVAYWYRRTAPSARSVLESHVRPLGRGRPGLVMARENDDFGLFTDLSGPPVLVLSVTELAPYLRAGGFDHVAYAWRASDADAGVRSLARLAVNGGLGAVLADAGADAAAPSDAGPSDAGELRLPYRAETARPHGVAGLLDTLRLGGVPGTAPQGVFDDFVVWDRALSFDEMAAVFRAGVDVGTACR